MKTAVLAALAAAVATAQPAPAQDQQKLPPLPELDQPVGNGHLQPRAAPGQTVKDDPELTRLLKTPDAGPVVQPHDLYGQPLGETPGPPPPPNGTGQH